jgi:hypothetical protein
LSCSNAATTTACKSGYRKSSAAGVSPVTCEACSNALATTCDAAASTHTACLAGNYLSSNVCTTCGGNVLTCALTSPILITACNDGYNLLV